MRCPRCQTDNPTASKFCGECSAPLAPNGSHDPPTHFLETNRLIGGKYEIAEEIGRGGMGVVYKARDIQLKRWVALKFLPSNVADSEDLRERFLIEAQAAAALSHPNICVIHEVGDDEGQPFIAMEYVEGETLRQMVKRKPLETGTALDIIKQVAAGLEEAHGKGIVHRDIKSGNIMVTEKGQTKIMDFGLAKLVGGPSLTKTETTLGTVGYMSPEQASGDQVDQRTDLWSAGAVLYELLTGELPFRGGHEVAVIHAIMYEHPTSLEGRTPPVPVELQRIVGRALEKDLDARYGSGAEMLADLRKYEAGLLAEAAGAFNLANMVKKLRKPKVAIPTALAVVGVVALGIWFAQRQADIRWAREELLPEIASLIEANDVWRNLIPPYRIAMEAEAILGEDPALAELIQECSREVTVLTEPSGADVFFKPYDEPEANWSFLGVTPLEGARVPIGIFRWKLEKEGYQTVLAAESSWNLGGGDDIVSGHQIVRKLDSEESIPLGMVRVDATATPQGPMDSFFIGRYEVTNREFKAFVDGGGYRNQEYWTHPILAGGREVPWDEAMDMFVDDSGQRGPSTWLAGDFPQGQGEHPVSGVSWYEAAAYAEYAGMSLPTADHWNVARGAFTPLIAWPQLGGFATFAPFSNFGGQGTVPVGSLGGVTAYGSYDMPGNVREWCWNESSLGRIIRGGSFEDNNYEFEYERQLPALDRSPRNGFRLAYYPDPGAIPEPFLGARDPQLAIDFRDLPPVSDEVFQVYIDQFSYDPTELNSEVESRVENPDRWTHEVVSFDAAYGGERILAHLFLPTNSPPPYQTVVYFPGSASTFMPSSEGLEDYYEFTMFLSYLVRNGRAVMYPVYKGTFERGSPELMVLSNPKASAGTRAYSDYLVQVIKDLRRSVDYLETRPDIEPEKLAFYGMSWGGYLGTIIPAVEKRFKASVLVAGGMAGFGRPEVNDLNYVGRVTTPTLILNGRYDTQFPMETSAIPMLDLLGTPPADKKLLLYDTDHIPPRTEYIKESLAWLEKYLGPVGG